MRLRPREQGIPRHSKKATEQKQRKKAYHWGLDRGGAIQAWTKLELHLD